MRLRLDVPFGFVPMEDCELTDEDAALRFYAQQWLRSALIRFGNKSGSQYARDRVVAACDARPGLAQWLVHEARANLAASDVFLLANSIAVIGLLGTDADRHRLQTFADHGQSVVAKQARAALFELVHRIG